MKTRILLGAVALVGVTVLMTRAVVSQERRAPAKDKQDAESQIETWVRYATAGEHHKLLNQMAGSWDTQATYWKEPGSLPVTSKGTSRRKWILGGRFLQEELDGGLLGLPFRGVGLYGYDSFEQKYTSAWVDTMSTAIMTNLGTYDAAARSVNFVGKYGDPWTGVKKDGRGVTRFVGKDKHVLEIFMRQADGREHKLLEIVYDRKAEGPRSRGTEGS